MSRTPTLASSKDTTVDELAADIQALRNDLSSLTGTISDMAREKGSEVSSIASRKADEAQLKAAEAAEFVSARTRDVQDQAENFVKQQPATALGIAAGVGFLVGMMSTRR